MSQLRALFAFTVFLASFLLFLVEPIAARQLLPILGGSAAVWITCLVFFQTALLLGYLYAHWLTRGSRRTLHTIVLAAAIASPIIWTTSSLEFFQGSTHPIWTVFRLLGGLVGLPFIVLAATSPLLQSWWARAENGPIPWKLYALSNLASLLALGLYPSLIEPNLTLHGQRFAWSCGFVVFVLLSVAITRKVRSLQPAATSSQTIDDPTLPTSPFIHKVLWLLLPMGASMQLSAVTSYLTANVAAIPLLWILPLGVYLTTLILAFQFSSRIPRGLVGRFLIVFLASLGFMLTKIVVSWPMRVSLIVFLIEIFLAGLFLHAEACTLRPRRASESTLFYLLFAAGGALGSFFIGILAPLVFTFNYDLSISFAVTALLALAATWNHPSPQVQPLKASRRPAPTSHFSAGASARLLWSVGSLALLALVFMIRIAYHHNTTVAVRNFYASLRVTEDHYTFPGATVRTLLNGTIQHGTQIFSTDQLRRTPTTYYGEDSGVGLALRYCCLNPDQSPRPRNIGVIGLGAGTIAAYGRPGDHIRFFEINPAVAPIAQNVFTYIRESGAQVDILPGDARATLARSAPQNFDVLVIDAFSGDAIPLHLLTTQAIALYRRHLTPNGILAFHVSNQHVDLGPPIARLAAVSGLQVRRVSSLSNDAHGEYGATWMLLTADSAFFSRPEVTPHAFTPDLRPNLQPWTDDYSALLPLLRW